MRQMTELWLGIFGGVIIPEIIIQTAVTLPGCQSKNYICPASGTLHTGCPGHRDQRRWNVKIKYELLYLYDEDCFWEEAACMGCHIDCPFANKTEEEVEGLVGVPFLHMTPREVFALRFSHKVPKRFEGEGGKETKKQRKPTTYMVYFNDLRLSFHSYVGFHTLFELVDYVNTHRENIGSYRVSLWDGTAVEDTRLNPPRTINRFTDESDD